MGKEKGRLQGALGAWGLQTVVGSGFFWAWFDALFMGVFFGLSGSSDLAEPAAMCMDACSALAFLVPLVAVLRGKSFSFGFAGKPLVAGIMGVVGSALLVVSGLLGSPVPSTVCLLAGGALSGVFCSAAQMGWGALYSTRGADGALPLVSGAFAFAVLLDFPLIFMVPSARAFFYAVFPLVSCLVLSSLPSEARSWPNGGPAMRDGSRRGFRSFLRTGLGMSGGVLVGLMLVMLGFGYMQHLVSFSAPAQGDMDWGTVVQLVRGLAAVAVFLVGLFAPAAAPVTYRAGLLVMIAGFMANVFFLGTDELWVSGSVVIGGYTVFDILVWVVASQAAHAQSHSPAATVAFVRMLAAVCYVAGAAAGICLAGSGELSMQAVRESNVVGYLVVVAVVMLLSSDDIWVLLSSHGQGEHGEPSSAALADPACPPAAVLRDASSADATSAAEAAVAGGVAGGLSERVVPERIEALGLTARERDVAVLLVRGRTQPWIAESLGISANTVGTHMRHIYQKAGVHNRREFMDYIGR